MTLARAAGVILAKELRTEFRSRQLLGTTAVFVLIVIVLFSFTFNPTSEEARRFGPGLLWLAFLFAGGQQDTKGRPPRGSRNIPGVRPGPVRATQSTEWPPFWAISAHLSSCGVAHWRHVVNNQ